MGPGRWPFWRQFLRPLVSRDQPLSVLLLIGIIITTINIPMALGLIYGIFIHQNPPITFFNDPFPVNKQVYEAGDPFIIKVSFCRHTNVPFKIFAEFQDGLIFPIHIEPTERPGREAGCYHNLDFYLFDMPPNLPSGRYTLHGKSLWKVNPVAPDRVVFWETQPFEVDNNRGQSWLSLNKNQ